MEQSGKISDGMVLSTDIFEEIGGNKIISEYCESTFTYIPQFECLKNCGLFENGLTCISNSITSIEDLDKDLKVLIKNHNESVIGKENSLCNKIDELLDMSIPENNKDVEESNTTLWLNFFKDNGVSVIKK